MKPLDECNITIIGLGFLMEYIFPCVRAALGERVSDGVVAVTADAGDLAGKRERLGIDVRLNDNEGALLDNTPDLILFAPPPSVARELITGCLKEYFSLRRRSSGDIPAILAFPPSPQGAFYQQMLGDDVKVVNIIPNMISSVNGEPVPGVASHLFTYPEKDNWTATEKAALNTLFLPMGKAVNLTPQLTMHVLSAEIAAHPLTELACAVSEVTGCADYRLCAGYLRKKHVEWRGYQSRLPASNAVADIRDEIAQRVELCDIVWYEALLWYICEKGVDEEQARDFLNPLFDLYYYEAEQEDRDTIIRKARKDATPGGMLELCLHNYYALVEPRIRDLLNPQLDAVNTAKLVSSTVHVILTAVAEKGLKLASGADRAFSPREHALLFAAFAQVSLELLGQEAGEAFLISANAAYGEARGRSLAAHAAENGDSLDMASYFAYGEWKWAGGFEKQPICEPDHLAYRVLHCPWCDAWNEAGLTTYGKYYCNNVDESILRGFSEGLHLELRHRLSEEPDKGCEFHWLCAGADGEASGVSRIAERIGDRYKRDFLYHCAQLYAVFSASAEALDAAFSAELLEGVHRAYISRCGAMSLLAIMERAKTM